MRLSTELAGSLERCVHIGDRESDIFEFFCLAQELGTYFLICNCVDRLAEDGRATISQVIAKMQTSGAHDIQFRVDRGNVQQTKLSVRHVSMTVCQPIGRKYRIFPHAGSGLTPRATEYGIGRDNTETEGGNGRLATLLTSPVINGGLPHHLKHHRKILSLAKSPFVTMLGQREIKAQGTLGVVVITTNNRRCRGQLPQLLKFLNTFL